MQFGRTEGGTPYLALEYLEGRPLSELPRGTDPLAPMLEVAQALSAVHAAGLCHRDVKPGNILVDGGGRAHLIDLGIAWSADMGTLTSDGMVIGTFDYLSPRRLRGEVPTPDDDWYAWAVTLYVAMEGSPPYTSAEIAHASRSGEMPELRFQRADPGSRVAALIRVLIHDTATGPRDRAAMEDFLGEAAPTPGTAEQALREAPTQLQADVGPNVLSAGPAPDATRELPATALEPDSDPGAGRPSRREVALGLTLGIGLTLVLGGAVTVLRSGRVPGPRPAPPTSPATTRPAATLRVLSPPTPTTAPTPTPASASPATTSVARSRAVTPPPPSPPPAGDQRTWTRRLSSPIEPDIAYFNRAGPEDPASWEGRDPVAYFRDSQKLPTWATPEFTARFWPRSARSGDSRWLVRQINAPILMLHRIPDLRPVRCLTVGIRGSEIRDLALSFDARFLAVLVDHPNKPTDPEYHLPYAQLWEADSGRFLGERPVWRESRGIALTDEGEGITIATETVLRGLTREEFLGIAGYARGGSHWQPDDDWRQIPWPHASGWLDTDGADPPLPDLLGPPRSLVDRPTRHPVGSWSPRIRPWFGGGESWVRGGEDGHLHLEAGKVPGWSRDLGSPVRGLALSPGEMYLAALGDDLVLRIFQCRNNQLVATYRDAPRGNPIWIGTNHLVIPRTGDDRLAVFGYE